ncbi:MAG: hypothetical protein HOG49_08115 [Candidatus Scalindua sp.]|jgi:hypothetical protein|nr:hypothetical protein [Candidatus Scalindua sp.]
MQDELSSVDKICKCLYLEISYMIGEVEIENRKVVVRVTSIPYRSEKETLEVPINLHLKLHLGSFISVMVNLLMCAPSSVLSGFSAT